MLAFCDELVDYIERNINSNEEILLVGEVNIPSNQQDHPDMVFFKDVLDGINLDNHVSFPTHWLGNSLDIIINTSNDTFIMDLTQDRLFSEHSSCTTLLQDLTNTERKK